MRLHTRLLIIVAMFLALNLIPGIYFARGVMVAYTIGVLAYCWDICVIVRGMRKIPRIR
jgi:hypothetical protein